MTTPARSAVRVVSVFRANSVNSAFSNVAGWYNAENAEITLMARRKSSELAYMMSFVLMNAPAQHDQGMPRSLRLARKFAFLLPDFSSFL